MLVAARLVAIAIAEIVTRMMVDAGMIASGHQPELLSFARLV